MEAKNSDFRIFRIFGKCRFCEFSSWIWGLGGLAIAWEWLWASNGRILSPFRAMRVHFDDVQDFSDFAIVSNGLTMFLEGPMTLEFG